MISQRVAAAGGSKRGQVAATLTSRADPLVRGRRPRRPLWAAVKSAGGRVHIIALAAAFVALGAEESKLTREGEFWVQTVTGSEAADAGGRLRITTRGPVTVRGAAQDQVLYTITKRVKAKNEEEARRRLSRFLVRMHRQGDTTIFAVAHAGDTWGSADVKVTAPRGSREVT